MFFKPNCPLIFPEILTILIKKQNIKNYKKNRQGSWIKCGDLSLKAHIVLSHVDCDLFLALLISFFF